MENSISNPRNYRKITVVYVVGKLFESLYFGRVKSLINAPQSKLQFGFMVNTSILVAAVMLTEDICETRAGKSLYVAFFDTKKAFGMVWHRRYFDAYTC